jgi:tRNA G26 N,N-dimethylase Trm1
MAKETQFQIIKRKVEEEKNKKVRGEATLTSLGNEQQRIFKQVEEEAGRTVSTVEEVEEICETLKVDIADDISKMVEILREEGIEV